MSENLIPTHIFFSWQSDSPRKTNLNAIRTALAKACKRVEKTKPNLKLVPDEATRGAAGSPNIALKIIEKIDASSMFVADITTITSCRAARPCPNPNVSFELGYAVAVLGWDRIILLFNGAIGRFPADLPFDFIQNRVTDFEYAETDPPSKRDDLSRLLEIAVTAILDKNPKRPAELKGLSREKVQHDRDVENMRWLMQSLHLPTVQQHINELPHMITDGSLWFFENFRAVVSNNLFSLYDKTLNGAVHKLYDGWEKTLKHNDQYNTSSNGSRHIFRNPGDMPLPQDRQEVWDEIDSGRRDMAAALEVILRRLRADYLEIDVLATNKHAWQTYRSYMSDVEQRPGWAQKTAPVRKSKSASTRR